MSDYMLIQAIAQDRMREAAQQRQVAEFRRSRPKAPRRVRRYRPSLHRTTAPTVAPQP